MRTRAGRLMHTGATRSRGARDEIVGAPTAAEEDGFILPMALVIMLMIIATSLALFMSGAVAIQSSRESNDFLNAQENVDIAFGEAEYRLRTATSASGWPATSARFSGVAHAAGKYESNYTYGHTNLRGPSTARTSGTVTANVNAGEVRLDQSREWRSRYVGSVQPSPDADGDQGPNNDWTYGVAAPGHWGAAVASEGNSWVDGSVTGDWYAYGHSTVGGREASDYDRVIAYDDRVGVSGTTSSSQVRRSAMTATMDRNLLNERVNACGTILPRYQASVDGVAGLTLGATNCFYETIIDEPIGLLSGGVTTIVSYGTVTISADITPNSTAELHIYSHTGSVRITPATPNLDGSGNVLPTDIRAGISRGGVYVYAPNALCKTYGGARLNLVGSLACRSVQVTGTVTHRAPRAEAPGVGAATNLTRYIEGPGYVDSLGGGRG